MSKAKLAAGFVTALFFSPVLCQAQSISIVSGNGQLVCPSCTGPTAVFTPLVVVVVDSNGAPLANATVTWIATQYGNQPVTTTTVTNFSGQASYVFTPAAFSSPSGLSEASVVASALNVSVQFAETMVEPEGSDSLPVFVTLVNGPTPPALTGGDGQSDPTPINISVTGLDGPVPGVQLALRATGGGPSVTCETQPGQGPGTVLTNSLGVATCTPLFGGRIGTGKYTIYVGGNFASFGPAPLTVTAGAPALIKYIMGNVQTVNVGVVAPIALTAEVTDLAENPLTGVSVVWTVTAGSAFLTNEVTTSASDGEVSARVTPTAGPGPVLVEVSLQGSSAVTLTFYINVNLIVTELQPVAGNNQQAPAGTAFSNPLVVQVVDNTAPVQGAVVHFAVTDGIATLSAPSATTNTQGQAQVVVTAGATPGPVAITAGIVSGGKTYTQNFTLTVTPAQIGAVIITEVANGGGYQSGAVVPGSQVVIFGQGLTPQGPVGGPTSGTWPLSLGGVTVTFTSGSSSIQAPIFSLSNGNGVETVTVQAPFELSPGNAQVTVTAGGVASQPFPVTVYALLPGIFQAVASDGRTYAVAQRPDGTFVSPTNPARPGN